MHLALLRQLSQPHQGKLPVSLRKGNSNLRKTLRISWGISFLGPGGTATNLASGSVAEGKRKVGARRKGRTALWSPRQGPKAHKKKGIPPGTLNRTAHRPFL